MLKEQPLSRKEPQFCQVCSLEAQKVQVKASNLYRRLMLTKPQQTLSTDLLLLFKIQRPQVLTSKAQ